MIGVMPGTGRRAAESTVRTQDGTRDAESLPEKVQEIGEPDALKGASPVREGADGKGLSGDTTCTANRQVYGNNGTSPAAYFIDHYPIHVPGIAFHS